MKVCVVLVNYRNAGEISRAVGSVLADDATNDITVVDNSDDDQEWEHLNDLLPGGIRTVRADSNLGFGSGCNLGIAHSDAEAIFLVNPDVRLLSGCTRTLRNALHDDVTLGAVSPRQFIDPNCAWILPASWLPTRIRAWAKERARYEPIVAERIAAALQAEHVRFLSAQSTVPQRALSGAALMVRRDALSKDAPVFDPRYFMYFEDTDLCMRLRKRNWGLAMVPQARAVHAWRNEAHKGPMMAQSADLYFDKFFPIDSCWMPRSPHAQTTRPCARGFERFPSAGLPLPHAWANDWILELSLDPLIDPAITHIGRGRYVAPPSEALEHFDGAVVYGRLSRLSLPYDSNSPRFLWPAAATLAHAQGA